MTFAIGMADVVDTNTFSAIAVLAALCGARTSSIAAIFGGRTTIGAGTAVLIVRIEIDALVVAQMQWAIALRGGTVTAGVGAHIAADGQANGGSIHDPAGGGTFITLGAVDFGGALPLSRTA